MEIGTVLTSLSLLELFTLPYDLKISGPYVKGMHIPLSGDYISGGQVGWYINPDPEYALAPTYLRTGEHTLAANPQKQPPPPS